MAKQISVTLPSVIEIESRGAKVSIDISKAKDAGTLIECALYKFGGIADAASGCKNEADTKKRMVARVKCILDGTYERGAGGHARLDPITTAALSIARKAANAVAAAPRAWAKEADPIKAAAFAVVARKHGKNAPTGAVAKAVAALTKAATARVAREAQEEAAFEV